MAQDQQKRGHVWFKPTIHRFCWFICAKCGLVSFNNARTRAVRRCEGDDD